MTELADPLVLDFVEWIARETVAGFGLVVTVTEDGAKLLRANGRPG